METKKGISIPFILGKIAFNSSLVYTSVPQLTCDWSVIQWSTVRLTRNKMWGGKPEVSSLCVSTYKDGMGRNEL